MERIFNIVYHLVFETESHVSSLASACLCSQGWHELLILFLHLPKALGSQGCDITPGLLGTGDWTQGFMKPRQTLSWWSYISSLQIQCHKLAPIQAQVFALKTFSAPKTHTERLSGRSRQHRHLVFQFHGAINTPSTPTNSDSYVLWQYYPECILLSLKTFLFFKQFIFILWYKNISLWYIGKKNKTSYFPGQLEGPCSIALWNST